MSNEPSNEQDFTLEEAVIALPRRNAAGAELHVRIRALALMEIETLWKGLPATTSTAERTAAAAAGKTPPPLTREEMAAKTRIVIEAGAISPRFAYDEGAPGVPVNRMHPDNLASLYAAILLHSGVLMEGATAEMLGFRYVERGGIANGDGRPRPVPPAEAAPSAAG